MAAQKNWHILANRTAVIPYGNFFFIWLFATRNDVFMWLTGWNYTTFSRFHRCIGRFVIVLQIIHAVAHTAFELTKGGRKLLLNQYPRQHWWTGTVALVFLALLAPVSVGPYRRNLYEAFRILHAFFALIVLIFLFEHTKYFSTKSYTFNNAFLWPTAAIWIFDYVVRLVRLVLFNWKTPFSRRMRTTATYDRSQNIIRVTVDSSINLKPQPGHYYFLYLPTLLRAYGNHPFTLASWEYGSNPASEQPESNISNGSSRNVELEREASSVNPPAPRNLRLTFLIGPCRGLSAQLCNSILKSPNSTKDFTALVEGPYGCSAPLFQSHTVLFIAGGTGITPVLAYMKSYLEDTHQPRNVTQHIHVVWTAKQTSLIYAILENELRGAISRPEVNFSLFSTGTSQEKSSLDTTSSADSNSAASSEPKKIIQFERPDVPRIINEVIEDKVGSMSVFACGPPSMADDTRATIAKALRSGVTDVEYFEDQFGW
ncbi:MAG: hypothetical protein M1814_000592 [Vezdaea aestivalis]|nr:MAG: hypothetical protein M1814_000592 [Vezdaea aestivalis]